MAKYVVKKTDNPLKLATQWGISPQKLLQSNGIQSLTAGQTINLPTAYLQSERTSPASGIENFYTGTANWLHTVLNGNPNPYPLYSTANTSTSTGSPQATLPMPNFMTQAMLPPPTPSLVSLTNGQTTPQGQGALALGANTYIPPNTGIPQNYATNPAGGTPTGSTAGSTSLPAGYVYTGGNSPEAIEQRRIWNIQAGGTGDEQVRLLSREDVWNRKANQRRRQQADRPQQPRVVRPTPSGNASNTSLSWRVG